MVYGDLNGKEKKKKKEGIYVYKWLIYFVMQE